MSYGRLVGYWLSRVMSAAKQNMCAQFVAKLNGEHQ